MPYTIRKAGDKYKLMKKDTGETVSTHDSRSSAMSQMKAIYANEGAAAKKGMMDSMYGDSNPVYSGYANFDQDDPRVNYDPLGGNKTYACANCEFFKAGVNMCQLVHGDIVATGYCDLWTRELSKDERAADYAMPVYMVEKSFGERVKEIVQELIGKKPDPVLTNFVSGFKTFGPDDRYWVAYYTNNAKDLDGEWFPEKAHDRYIERLDSGTVPMPELWYWHEPIRSGKALWIDRIGHIMMAVGEFFDNPTGQIMKEFYKTTKEAHKLSHGFLYPRSQFVDGVYWDYTTFEISPLPASVAANPFTAFGSVEEIGKPMNEQKKQQLVTMLGAERAKALLGEGEVKSKELDDLKLEFKGATSDPVEARIKALETSFNALVDVVIERLPVVTKAKKKGAEGSPEEEDSESPEEAVAEGDKPKGKKKEVTPVAPASDPNLATVLTGLTNAVNQINAALAPLQADMKAIKNEFANPVSATRSPYTVVPPGDPAIAALAAKMTGQGGDPTLAPGTQQQPQENIADFNTVFGGTQIYEAMNGNRRP